MALKSVLPDSANVNALEPEELSALLLAEIHRAAGEDPNNRFRPAPTISITNFCRQEAQAYTNAGQPDCSASISAAFAHLVALGMLAPDTTNFNSYGWFVLTRRGQRIRSQTDFEHYKRLSLYPKGAIHPVIEDETYSEFLRGDYETAVFKAFKALEVRVRAICKYPAELLGQKLMIKAFHHETSPLRDPEEVFSEREALMQLFAGAIARFKNPTSHREVDIGSAAEAVETIQIASLLMRIVDRRSRQQDAGQPGQA